MKKNKLVWVSILQEIENSRGKQMNASVIAREVGCAPHTASEYQRKLEKRGYITYKKAKGSRGTTLYFLTEKGKAILAAKQRLIK